MPERLNLTHIDMTSLEGNNKTSHIHFFVVSSFYPYTVFQNPSKPSKIKGLLKTILHDNPRKSHGCAVCKPNPNFLFTLELHTTFA